MWSISHGLYQVVSVKLLPYHPKHKSIWQSCDLSYDYHMTNLLSVKTPLDSPCWCQYQPHHLLFVRDCIKIIINCTYTNLATFRALWGSFVPWERREEERGEERRGEERRERERERDHNHICPLICSPFETQLYLFQ